MIAHALLLALTLGGASGTNNTISMIPTCGLQSTCGACVKNKTIGDCVWNGLSCSQECGDKAPCYNYDDWCFSTQCLTKTSCFDCVNAKGCSWDGYHCNTTCNTPPCLSSEWECDIARVTKHTPIYGPDHHDAHKLADVDAAMTFMLMSLFAGAIMKWAAKHVMMPPYTVSIFLVGALLSVVYGDIDPTDTMGETIAYVRNLHPHVILMPLLPPLIWESAFDIDWHVFKLVLPSCLILAGPGVGIQLTVLATFMRAVFPYEWNWNVALICGTILSATDPVAVVATLQDLSAPTRLSTVIEGESLLNDGTAYVIFTIMVSFPNPSAMNILESTAQLAILGPIFGYVAARVTTAWLGCIDNMMLEISITVIGFYGTFVFAEIMIKTSGVLAIVAYGVYFAARGKFAFSIGTLHASETVYSFLAFMANTIIFSLSGVVVFQLTDTNRHIILDPVSWGYLGILYVVIHLVRFGCILLFWPCLSRLGYGLTFREILMMTFSGLRGAIGLSLVLLVHLYGTHIPEQTKAEMEFYVSGIVLLTLVVNGTFAPTVYRWLQIYPEDKHRPALVKKATAIVSQHARRFELEVLRGHWFFENVCWSCVHHLVLNLERISVDGGKIHLIHEQLHIKHRKKTCGQILTCQCGTCGSHGAPGLIEVFGDMHREICLFKHMADNTDSVDVVKHEVAKIQRTKTRELARHKSRSSMNAPQLLVTPEETPDDLEEFENLGIDHHASDHHFLIGGAERMEDAPTAKPASPVTNISMKAAAIKDVKDDNKDDSDDEDDVDADNDDQKVADDDKDVGQKKSKPNKVSLINRMSSIFHTNHDHGPATNNPERQSAHLPDLPKGRFLSIFSKAFNQNARANVLESTSLTLAYFSAVKAAYARDIERGMLSAEAAIVLQEANDRGSELWTLPGRSNVTLMEALEMEFETLMKELQVEHAPMCGGLLANKEWMQRWWSFRDTSVAIEALAGYCMCHSSVADELVYHLHVDLEEKQVTCFIVKARAQVMELIKMNPDCAWITKATVAARLLSVNQAKKADELYESGFLSHTDQEHLKEMLYRRVHELNSFRSMSRMHANRRYPGASRLHKAIAKLDLLLRTKGAKTRAKVAPVSILNRPPSVLKPRANEPGEGTAGESETQRTMGDEVTPIVVVSDDLTNS